MNLSIEEGPRWQGFGETWLVQAIVESIAEHCANRQHQIRDATLVVTVNRAESRDHFAILRVHLSGKINGRNFYQNCTAIRKNAHGSAGGIVGHAVAAMVNAAITVTLDNAVSQDPKFIQCLAECMATLHEAIDRAAGVVQSVLARRWYLLQSVGRALFFGSFIAAVPVVILFVNHPNHVVGLPIFVVLVLLIGLVMGSTFNFMFWTACLLFFPDKFYTKAPVGRRVLARSGLQTPLQMRVMVLVVYAALIGFVVYLGCFAGIE